MAARVPLTDAAVSKRETIAMHERRFIPTPLLQTYALYQVPHHVYFAIECMSCGVVKDIAREYLEQAGAYSRLKELSPRFRCTSCGQKNARIMAGDWGRATASQ